MIVNYNSVSELCAAYERQRPPSGYFSESLDWYNNETEADTLRFARQGKLDLVPAAEAMLAQLDTAIETPRKVWERAPAGAFCAVPDVLAGLPTPMRRQRSAPDERAPITILVCTTSSAGIDARTLAKRGTAILALTLALTKIRPTILRQLAILGGREGGETILTSVINTAPLDLATACYVLTSAGFDRRLIHGLAKVLNDYRGYWPQGFSLSRPEPYLNLLPSKFGLNPAETLIIGPARLGAPFLADPVSWIQAEIFRFTQSTKGNTYA